MTSSKPHDKILRDYLREIGHRGGKKRAQHPKAVELNRKAAEARWRKAHPSPKKV